MRKGLYLLAALFLIPSIAFSQGVTTAAMNGLVADDVGKPLAGATVQATHIPTGTRSGAVTNSAGRYNIRGLRPGGPYSVVVTMVGFARQQKDNIMLSLDENLKLDFTLTESGVQLQAVTVTATRSDVINTNRTGSAQLIAQSEIESLPTIARSLHDYSRLSPQIISSTSEGSNVSGRNSKYNNIQVDGAVMSDAFGLNTSGTPGGAANAEPISLDAIQEFQVAIAPFDVRQGGFTGGLINAITRGGTNFYHGSAYVFRRDESLIAKSPVESWDVRDRNGNGIIEKSDSIKKRAPYPDFDETTVGGSVGGKIIADKLFFFANGEYRGRSDPQVLGIQDPAAANNFDVPLDSIRAIQAIARNTYNYDPGSIDPYTRTSGDVKLFMRLDYNLSNRHRLTLRHNYVDARQDNSVTRSRFFFSFEGQEYVYRSRQNQSVLQLNSVFGHEFANEFRAAATFIRDKRDYQSNPFPAVTIQNLGDDARYSIGLGVDRFSQANAIDQDIIEITDNFTWFAGNFHGDHVVTLGTTNQFVTFDNLFAQDIFGSYTFASVEDFAAGKPSSYSLSYLRDGGKPRAKYGYAQLAFYAQDEWGILDNFRLTFGVRGDIFTFNDTPTENPTFAQFFPGLHTSEMPSPASVSPRMGFNWDVRGDKTLQARGGVGYFAGRTPGVWIGNQFSNTGMDYYRINLGSRDKLPQFNPDPYRQPTQETDSTLKLVKTTEVNITDPDFQMPQLLRADVAADYQLSPGFYATVEFIYGKTIYDVLIKNVNLLPMTAPGGGRLVSIDGRPMYNGKNTVSSNDFTGVYELTNSRKGYQSSVSIQLQKPFRQGFLPEMSLNFAYVYSQAKDVNSATSSRAVSNWQFNHVVDPNDPELSTSLFEIPHRIMGSIAYQFKYGENWFGGDAWATTLGLYYEGRSGSPYSFLYYTRSNYKFASAPVQDANVRDANNDDIWGNDLVYIPTGPQDDKVILVAPDEANPGAWTSQAGWAELESFLNSVDGLERGRIMKRFSLRQPWRDQLDFRLTQDIPTVKGQKFQVTLDVMNVLNLLDKDWGKQKYVSNSAYSLFEFRGYDRDTGRMRIAYVPNSRGNTEDDIFETSDFWSRWQMQLGLRYTF
ncbi:MAG: TonB-dependent receptor [Chloroflexota bacterium]